MVSNNENVIDSKIKRITKEMLKKEEGDFYEMVHIALEDPENEIEILDDAELYLQLSKEVNSETPNWQAEIFFHPDMSQIALAALYHELISADDFVFLIVWHNAAKEYGAEKVCIKQLFDKIDDEVIFLEQYVKKQHAYSKKYCSKYKNNKNIYETIEKNINDLTRRNKRFGIVADITGGYKDNDMFWKIDHSRLMSFEGEMNKKIFTFPHPSVSRVVHKFIFGKGFLDSASRLGIFDAALIRGYQEAGQRLADLRFNKIKSLIEAHNVELNATMALAHDLFHQVTSNLVFSELRNVIEVSILPLTLELNRLFPDKKFYGIYEELVDLDFRIFRNLDFTREEYFRFFFAGVLRFSGERAGKFETFFLTMHVAYDMAFYSSKWKDIVPGLKTKQLHIEGFFKYLPDLIDRIKIFYKKCNKMIFIGTDEEFNKKNYIILKALIDYLYEHLNKFDSQELKYYLNDFLKPACSAVQQCFSRLNLEPILSSFLKNIDGTIDKSRDVEQTKIVLSEFKSRIKQFETAHENAYDISKNSSSFFNGFKLFKQEVVPNKQQLAVMSV